MNSQGDALVSTWDLKKSYDSPAGPLPILKGVNFGLNFGEMAMIVGRSGSGKSTLLHLLGGLDRPTSGKIIFEGQDMASMKERQLAKIRNARIGFVFQFYHLLPELTLYQNVILPSMILGKRDEVWVREVLKRVKLLSRQDHYPSQLSGGEQQRTAIARALVNRPSVILCDEPTGNLDEETAQEIIGLLNDLNERQGQAFVIVTHDETMAWRYSHIYRLQDGVLSLDNGKRDAVRQTR